MEQSKYTSWTVKQLKDELRSRRASQVGKKKALIQRLVDYDRNDNFRDAVPLDDADAFSMEVPCATTYRDITTIKKTGQISKPTLQAYVQSQGGSLSPGEKLYEARFVRYVRNSVTNDETYYKAEVWAEMKKSVSYHQDILVKDQQIVECQCDCAAGMGPTSSCKHLMAMMLAVVDAADRTPKLENTCTGILQTFHKPKRSHRGSPMKAHDVPSNTNSDSAVCDPRLSKHMKMDCYPHMVKNMTINYISNYPDENIPLIQTCPPASVKGIALDHDYLAKTPEDMFLQKLNLDTITPEEADRIEEATIKQSNCSRWKEERSHRLPSSKFGKIQSTLSVAAKQNLAKEIIKPTPFTSLYTTHGHQHEPAAIAEYEKRQGVVSQKCGLVINPDLPYLCASPDGLIGDDVVLEVKCPQTAAGKMISPQTVPYLKMQGGELQLDNRHPYYAQVQGQMLLTERKLAHFVVYTIADIKVIGIPFDDVYCEKLKKDLEEFYLKHFKSMLLRIYFYKS